MYIAVMMVVDMQSSLESELQEYKLLNAELRKEIRHLSGCEKDVRQLQDENQNLKKQLENQLVLKEKINRYDNRQGYYAEVSERAASIESENATLV